MNESKITASHRRRTAVIYVRQSSLTQVDRNKESTARQYDLVARAQALGWPPSAVSVIDDDLGVSGSSTAGRSGFADLVTRVGLGQVGMVVSLECSRLARNNADWYRLLDLAGMTDTLIADGDGTYDLAVQNRTIDAPTSTPNWPAARATVTSSPWPTCVSPCRSGAPVPPSRFRWGTRTAAGRAPRPPCCPSIPEAGRPTGRWRRCRPRRRRWRDRAPGCWTGWHPGRRGAGLRDAGPGAGPWRWRPGR